MAVARDVLPVYLALWGSCSPPWRHRINATENSERHGVTSPVLCGRSTPPCERVLHPCETIPTHTLQEIGPSLKKPRLLTARMGIASSREHDERRVHRRHPLHVDTAGLPGIRETEGRGVMGQ